MSIRSQILDRMYKAGRVSEAGLRKAVEDGTISEAEYAEIAGEPYAEA